MKALTATLAIVGMTLSASASVVPFTETFASDPSNWKSGSGANLTWFATGGLDGSSYVSGSSDLNTAGPFGLALIRGEDATNASGGAFVGNYLASGITTIEFDFRHNAGVDLDIALRIADLDNFPGLAVQTSGLIASGQWVRLTFDLTFGNPLMTLEGPPSLELYNLTMSSIGNIQVTSFRPDGLVTPLIADFDIDNVTITPTPAGITILGLTGLALTRRRRN